MSARHNQQERLLVYLRKGNTVDRLSSWQNLGIAKPSSRVSELIRAGHPIQKAWKTVFNRFGEKIRVKYYWINKEDRQ